MCQLYIVYGEIKHLLTYLLTDPRNVLGTVKNAGNRGSAGNYHSWLCRMVALAHWIIDSKQDHSYNKDIEVNPNFIQLYVAIQNQIKCNSM